MRERYYSALFRSKAPWAHRRQELIEVFIYAAEGDAPPRAEAIARDLVSRAQTRFQCDVNYLIVDKVLL